MSAEGVAFRSPRQPELYVERGMFSRLADLLVETRFRRPVLVTGGRSVRGRDDWGVLMENLLNRGYGFLEFTVRGEPDPDVINEAVAEILRDAPDSDVVVAVGGGSVLDAGKAIAAGTAIARRDAEGASPIVEHNDERSGGDRGFDISLYLEGVGEHVPDGTTLPVIAFPTTAGTGSEATMNAVISRIGPEGYKKSLRHPRFVPRLAVIDSSLHEGCPPDVTVASGLDAITQLVEAYLSTKASPITDALATAGLELAGRAFPALAEGADTPALRTDMALAAYLSGVCLAAAGLGVVHGFASPLGAVRSIPHGVVCGLLLAPATDHTLASRLPAQRPDVKQRYAAVSRALGLGGDATTLASTFRRWAEPLGRLSDYGFAREELDNIVGATGLKNHPVKLDATALTVILEEVL